MKKYQFIKFISLLLVVCTFSTLLMACQKNNEPDAGNTVSTVDDDISYEFTEGVNFEGRKYTILNCLRDQWQYNAYITSHEMSSEPINNAIYVRTAWLEKTLNCKLEEHNFNIDTNELTDAYTKDVYSGSNTYSAAYLQPEKVMSEIIEGSLYPLNDISSLKLDKSYWCKEIMEETSLGNVHYSAASDAQLMHIEGTWGVLFNIQYLNDREAELPYEMVRNGTWTIEEMHKICRQVSNLNGDESFDFNENGNALYGFVTYWNGIGTLLYGTNGYFGKKDVMDFPYLTCNTAEFYERAQKVADFCSDPGTFYYGKTSGYVNSYDKIFLDGRAVFMGGQLMHMALISKTNIDFGIVPFPKYDVDQPDYNVSASVSAPFLVVPIGCTQKEDIGLIMDAMSFEANRTLVDVYYVDHLELKTNTGELSADVEMIELIRKKRSYDPLVISGFAEDLRKQMIYAVNRGGSDITSTVENYRGYPETQISKLKYHMTNKDKD